MFFYFRLFIIISISIEYLCIIKWFVLPCFSYLWEAVCLGCCLLTGHQICLFWYRLALLVVVRGEARKWSAWVWYAYITWSCSESMCATVPHFTLEHDHFICTWNTRDFFPISKGFWSTSEKRHCLEERSERRAKDRLR